MAFDDKALSRLIRESPQTQAEFMDAWAEAVVTDIDQQFNTSPPGRTYRRGNGRVHVASVVGFPPNVDTGALRASIGWERRGNTKRRVHDGVDYGAALEFGTERNGGPRPFMGPVIANWRNGKLRRFASRRLKIE